MPIKIDVIDSNSSVYVKPKSNDTVSVIKTSKDQVAVRADSGDEVKITNGSGVDSTRLEMLIRELQLNKQNLGFVFLDEFTGPNYDGNLSPNNLKLLKSYLINKVAFRGNVYSLAKVNNYIYTYWSPKQDVNPNQVELNVNTGYFKITNVLIDHAHLDNLNWADSGHTGFAGIESGTTAYWNSKPNYRPAAGMLVVYTDYVTYVDPDTGKTIYVPGVKIGDGNAYLSDIAFLGDGGPEQGWEILMEHINNWEIHVSATDRARWDQKLNVKDEVSPSGELITGDLLVFTRD